MVSVVLLSPVSTYGAKTCAGQAVAARAVPGAADAENEAGGGGHADRQRDGGGQDSTFAAGQPCECTCEPRGTGFSSRGGAAVRRPPGGSWTPPDST